MTIHTKQLTKIYNQNTNFPVTAVDEVNVTIDQGEFVAVMGPSGSGKTTFLNMIGGIDSPTHGEVFIDGTEITKFTDKELISFRRDNIGFIFQDYSLLPVLTALENVEFVMQLQGRPPQECQKRANELLKEVGLGDRTGNVPGKLSGGQQQRVAVARALAPKPKFILADEPTANLDAESVKSLLNIMQHMNEKEGVTFIFSTHDPRVIERAKRVIVIEDGRIAKDGCQ